MPRSSAPTYRWRRADATARPMRRNSWTDSRCRIGRDSAMACCSSPASSVPTTVSSRSRCAHIRSGCAWSRIGGLHDGAQAGFLPSPRRPPLAGRNPAPLRRPRGGRPRHRRRWRDRGDRPFWPAAGWNRSGEPPHRTPAVWIELPAPYRAGLTLEPASRSVDLLREACERRADRRALIGGIGSRSDPTPEFADGIRRCMPRLVVATSWS